MMHLQHRKGILSEQEDLPRLPDVWYMKGQGDNQGFALGFKVKVMSAT